MAFKVTKEQRRINGKLTSVFVAHDGINGTGVTLPYTCSFCADKDGKPTAAFRTQRQRIRHATVCQK